MPERDDLLVLRQRAANVRHGEIIAAAEARGWTHTATRGKGRHGALTRRGYRPIIVPRKLKRAVVLSIIRALEQG